MMGWRHFFACAWLLTMPLVVHGGVNESLSFTVGCEGLTSNGGFIRLTRDNTGNDREAFSVTATDGAGNVIYQPDVDSFLVGGRVSFGEGTFYRWTAPPTANPLTLTIASVQGNNLPRQTIFTLTGTCAGLPGAAQANRLPARTAGLISPPVQPGQAPPVPSTDAAIIEQLPGYAIVNAEALNLRSGDAPEYSIVGVVRGGTRAAVIGRNQQFSWWLLDVGGVRGWANADFLFLRGDLTDVPIVEARGEFTPVTMVTFVEQPVYRVAGSDLNRDILCNVLPGEYRVVGRNATTDHYQLQAVCDNGVPVAGWLPAENGAVRNPAGIVLPIVR